MVPSEVGVVVFNIDNKNGGVRVQPGRVVVLAVIVVVLTVVVVAALVVAFGWGGEEGNEKTFWCWLSGLL